MTSDIIKDIERGTVVLGMKITVKIPEMSKQLHSLALPSNGWWCQYGRGQGSFGTITGLCLQYKIG